MATGTKKLYEDANSDYLTKKNATDNYGTFSASDSTNKYKAEMDDLYDKLKNYGEFNASDYLLGEQQKKINAENAVSNYGDFNYDRQSQYDDLLNKILNKEDFTYDVNGDALYQQYKDQYLTQGKLAMMDTMGQATALTGGYANSYAQSVGQQAYQGYLQQLNDKVPELYKLALDKYNSDRQDTYNQYSTLSNDRSTKYGEWSDGYNRLVADRDYWGTNYNNEYNREYGEWTDQFNMTNTLYGNASNAYNTSWNQDYTTWEGNYNLLSDQRDSAFNYALNLYDQYRDTVADDQWQKEFDEMKRMNDNTITTQAQQTAANDCYAAIEQGVMPSDEQIKKAGLDKSTVANMVNERKKAINLDNQAKQASIDKTNYAALEAELEAKYDGYISPEELAKMQQAENSEAVQVFKAAVLTKNEFGKRGSKATIDGKTKRFDNYSQYIDAVLESNYKNGKLTENEVAYLKGYYGIE